MIPEQLKDKVPPHNEEAEKATLGALLLDRESISLALQYLRPDDFYKTSHKKIFEAIIRLFDRGEALDIITLIDELRDSGDLDISGGASYVSSITNSVPTSANIEYYAKIVQECSIRRVLINVSQEIKAKAHDETLESNEIIEQVEQSIFNLTDKHHRGSYKTVKELLNITINEIERRYNSKETYTGVPSGFSDLDNLTGGFQDSELIIIGARPSIGKTSFALSMASNMAVHHRVPVGFFTLEMSALSLTMRLISVESKINFQNIRNGLLKPADFHNIMHASSLIHDAPLLIEDTPNMRLLDLRAQARRMKLQENIKIIFIDYIGLITADNTNIQRHEQVSEISKSLKFLARDLNIPIVVLSQVTRQVEGKKPTLADIRESGSIEQDADVVMFLHRERGADSDATENSQIIETELIIAKNRNGPTDTVKIAFIPKFTRFESLSRETV